MQDWNQKDQCAGLENARLELNGPMRRGGKCRTGIKRTKNAGVENVGLTKYKPKQYVSLFTNH